MINQQILENAGYKKWQQPNAFPHSDYFYQKSIFDGKGKKYSINFVFYAPYKAGMSQSITLDVCFNEPHTVFNKHGVGDCELKDLEKLVDDLFVLVGAEYYCLYSE